MSSHAQLKRRVFAKRKKLAIQKASQTASSNIGTISTSIDPRTPELDSPSGIPSIATDIIPNPALLAFQSAELAMGAKELRVAEILLKLQTMAQQLSTYGDEPATHGDAVSQWREIATAMLAAADDLDDLHHDIHELHNLMLEQVEMLKAENP